MKYCRQQDACRCRSWTHMASEKSTWWSNPARILRPSDGHKIRLWARDAMHLPGISPSCDNLWAARSRSKCPEVQGSCRFYCPRGPLQASGCQGGAPTSSLHILHLPGTMRRRLEVKAALTRELNSGRHAVRVRPPSLECALAVAVALVSASFSCLLVSMLRHSGCLHTRK